MARRMGYLIKGPKTVHKKHLNQTESKHIDEENDTPTPTGISFSSKCIILSEVDCLGV